MTELAYLHEKALEAHVFDDAVFSTSVKQGTVGILELFDVKPQIVAGEKPSS